jgi:hypothetical protein
MRRGGTTLGVVATLSIIGGLALTAFVFSPGTIFGSEDERTDAIVARDPEHRAVVEGLTALLGRSHEIVAVRDRTVSPLLEVVVWLDDAHNPGIVDVDEVALLCHSETLQTIALHMLEEDDDEDQGEEPPDTAAPAPLSRSDIEDTRFGAAWRSRRDVSRRVVAAGVSDLAVETVVDIEAGRQMLRISFTWAPETTDGADEATALVDVVRRRDRS